MQPLKKTVIFGATGGIGKSLVKLFLGKGYNVLAFGKTVSKIDELKKTFSDDANLTCRQIDFTDIISAEEIIQDAFSNFGNFNVLINCTGSFLNKTTDDTTLNDWTRILNINLSSIFLSCSSALPYLRKSGKGHIINFSSIGGKIGLKDKAAYSAAKFGVAGFSKSLAKELKQDNVKVNIIYPYLVDSEELIDWAKSTEENAILSVDDVSYFIYDLVCRPHRFHIEDLELKPFLY